METRLRRCAMHEASHATLATIHHLPLARVRRQGAFSGSCPASVAELAHAARHLNQHNRCGRHCETGMNRASFGRGLRVKLKILQNPFLLRHKQPIITLFVHPFGPFFISSMDEPSQGRYKTKLILVRQKRAAFNSRQLAYLALLSLILVSVVGPILSMQYGIERALLIVVPVLYATAFLGACVVWAKRSLFGFGIADVAHVCLELMVCPILLVPPPGSLAMLAAMRRASSRVSSLAAARRPPRNRRRRTPAH